MSTGQRTSELQRKFLGSIENLGAYNRIERSFDYGFIGAKNTYGLKIYEAVTEEEVAVVNSDHEEFDDRKVIYSHPRNLPFSPGSSIQVRYSGSGKIDGFRKRHVDDTAVLIVDEKAPLKGETDLESVETFLIGDKEDQALEGKSVRLQAYPKA